MENQKLINAVVRFYEPGHLTELPLLYSIIAARFQETWIFVRHCERETWEIAGGHIEPGEDPEAAARRELTEETGAEDFSIVCVATYSVTADNYLGYGRLYIAIVTRLGEIRDKSEIAEVRFSDTLPANATYPEIQRALMGKCIEYMIVNRID
jgi:8-oxo-dGTP diphosphatase